MEIEEHHLFVPHVNITFNECESYFKFYESSGDLPTFGQSLCPKCHQEKCKSEFIGPVRRIERYLKE